ncbi:DEAD/DEAH box helicase [Caldibacillus lycopersici]|uniref:DEAD/DEAH box helicase n=1 Tax=Perspicuibacillus lycopersici TaxID=1325689 RepID=A0AAE3LM78_9BACI|nr:DEAD/DEAH box helicase [Perspicuibacillus lycopersici]MCU9613270.1 DEAD/DEAH box helicase [Perspicuibacillus lycopersici]
MLKMKQFDIHCHLLADGSFFLYAFDEDGAICPTSVWGPALFHWHEGSYYGTNLKTDSFLVKIGRQEQYVEGIIMDPLDALELYGTEPFNHLVQWEFDDFSQTLLAVAPVVYENVSERKWGPPDFQEWKNGKFQWKVPDEVWEEFLPQIWEEPITETDSFLIEPDAANDYKHPMRMRDFVQSWFHHGVESYITRQPAIHQRWLDRKVILEEAMEQGIDLLSYFDEKRFMQWVGLLESDLPFTIGLHLQEPEQDGEMWKLSTVLRDRKKPDTVVTFGSDGKHMPKRWLPYVEQVLEEQQRICQLLPWLEKEDLNIAHEPNISLRDQMAILPKDGSVSIVKEELFEEDAWEFLTNASEKLLMIGIEIHLPSWWEAIKSANMRLKARVSTGSGGPSFVGLDALMDFEWRVSMNNVDLSEAEFRKLMEENRRLVNIGGRWMKIDPSFIRQMQAIMEKAEKEGMRVQDFIEQQLLYGNNEEEAEEMLDEDNDPRIFSRIQIELHPKLRSFVENLTDLKDIPDLEVPASFLGELRPYQKKGMNWLYFLREYGFGACLADDMGLGKTIQLISYLLLVKERQPAAGPALIICPTSVLGNWQRELARFAPHLQVYLHYGANRSKGEEFTEYVGNGNDVTTSTSEENESAINQLARHANTKISDFASIDVVLTTYGLSHLDAEELASVKWGTIVLDEAQNIKNAGTKQSRAIRRLKGQHHIALTGTPMENRLTELWSIYDFINKGYLGSLTRFQQRFVLPIEREHNEERIKALRKLISPFLLRRTKKDEEVALNLPEKLEQKEYCPLTAEQAVMYEQIVKDTFDKIANLSGFERKGFVLKLLGQLKQLCNHPALYLKDALTAGSNNLSLIERSTKLEKLMEIIDTMMEQDESGLIFTQYLGMGDIIRTVLEKKYKIKVPFLNGSTSKQARDNMIESFQNGEFPILLLSLKAGGTGLNLTQANHVIHYDRWWNPAVENQATDRAYRIGQTKFVHVHKFISTGTLEEKIDAMLEKKQSLNEEIIQSDQWLADMSNDDLYDILKLD